MGRGRHAENSQFFLGQHGPDVAHQAAAVVGMDDDVHLEAALARGSPGDGQHPFRLAAAHALEAGTTLAVDRHAAPDGDVAGDRLGRHRVAATREGRGQVTDTLDVEPRGGLAAPRGRCPGHDRQRGIGLQPPVYRAADLGDRQVAGPQPQVQGLGAGLAELRQQLRHGHGVLQAEAGDLALVQFAALLAVPALVLPLEPGAHLGAAARRGQVTELVDQPVPAGLRLLAGDDLDDLAVGQLVVDRHHPAVDAGAAAAVPEFRVHLVGIVERRGPAGQVHDVALRGQHVDAVLEQVGAHAIEEVRVGLAFGGGGEQLAQPLDLAVVGGVAPAAFLVTPVSRDPELGMLVHLARADLHFDGNLAGTDDGRVQRAVGVVLGGGDVVVELARNVGPAAVHQAQRRIAVGHAVGQDAHRADVEHLLEAEVLALHLPPDAVDVLGPAGDLGRDAGLREHAVELRDDRRDVALAVRAPFVQLAGDEHVAVRLEVAKGQVLQFPLELPDTEPAGQRRVHLAGLAGQALARILGEVARFAQVMELLGEPDQHQPRVGDDRQQHLAQDLGLAGRQLAVRRPAVGGPEAAERAEFGGEARRPLAEALRRRLGGQRPVPDQGGDQGPDDGILVGLQRRQQFGHRGGSPQRGRTAGIRRRQFLRGGQGGGDQS